MRKPILRNITIRIDHAEPRQYVVTVETKDYKAKTTKMVAPDNTPSKLVDGKTVQEAHQMMVSKLTEDNLDAPKRHPLQELKNIEIFEEATQIAEEMVEQMKNRKPLMFYHTPKYVYLIGGENEKTETAS
jgi:hypothetical protein